MAGIPSADAAHSVRRAVIRLLLRCALLTGLVIAGWLLGSGTGLAQESWTPQGPGGPDQTAPDQPPRSLDLADLVAGPAAITKVPLADVHVDDLLPAIAVPRLPVTSAVVVLEPVLLEPVLEPVLAVVAPEPVAAALTGSQIAASEPEPPSPAADPAPTPVAGSSAAAAAAPTLPYPATADPPGNRSAEAPAPPDHPSPIPQRAPGSTTTFCLIAPASSNATTKSAHSVTLNDVRPETNLTLRHHRMCLRAAGVPGSLNQRPSTSPD